MSFKERLEAGLRRWRRVHDESGPLGLSLRAAARAIRSAGETVTGVADRLIGDVPYRYLTHPQIRRELEALRILTNRHFGRRIFILGTGPSLNRVDFSALDGELVIAVNLGFLHLREIGLKPTYAALIDEIYGRPEHQRLVAELADYCRANGVELLCRREIARAVQRRPEPPVCHGVHLIMRSRYLEATGRPLPIDFTVAQADYESVIHFAIAASLIMGAKQIVLLGCDMSYFAEPKKLYRHSYADQTYIRDDKPSEELFGMDQVELLELAHAEFRSFRALRRVAEERGVEIVNAAESGYLEVFERRPLSELLASTPSTGTGKTLATWALRRSSKT